MVLQALLVTLQLLFKVLGRRIKTLEGFCRRAMGLQDEACGQMQTAIRLKTEALLFNGHMSMHRAFKIFLAELLQALLYVDPECLTDIDVLAGDLNLHGCENPSAPPLVIRHGRAKC
jgi:hypothetical protein